MENDNYSPVTADLCFLIHKFLSGGPLKRTLQVFDEELEDCKILPKRLDWLGNEHERTVADSEHQFPLIRPDYLLQLCCRAGIASNSLNSGKVKSLFSLNKSALTEYNFKQLCDYVNRRNLMPTRNKNVSCNLTNILRGREISGPLSRYWITSPKLYSSLQFQRRTLGHLSAVYCLLFDHTGKYIITGADDLLIKLWSSRTGRLIATFRGASSEMTDIAVSLDNTLLAAGSIDRILRIWDLQTSVPIAVLTAHTGMITSVNFCPSPSWDLRYLVTTSTDGSVAFWTYTYGSNGKVDFRNKPTMYQEKMRPGQAQMICSSFSPGGSFLATGSADHHVRVYYMKGDEGPHRILETEAHNDRVDSIQWAHSGLRFLSGSKDGTAIIWTFECQQWKTLYLNMETKLANDISKISNSTKKPAEDPKKLKVTMVTWDYSDKFVITAVGDNTLKVWIAQTGVLDKILTGHTDEVYVLEAHPHDQHVILSAGHDGQMFVWDLLKGEMIWRFINTIEGQGYGAVFDVKWSPDGTQIAASDSHGHLLMFGFGNGSPMFEYLPKELFFHTDYRPLVRDLNNYVLDEQTQIPPHLMPPPFLVDIDGNPYPPMLQRLVPGREHCKTEQLVPSIVLGNEGTQEVIQVVADDNNRGGNSFEPNQENDDIRNSSRSTVRRIRDLEGIRQSTGDWQNDPNIKWKKNILVQPLKNADKKRVIEQIDFIEKLEMKEYHRQMCQRPHMISINTQNESVKSKSNEKKKNQSSYKTRGPKYTYYVRMPAESNSSDTSEGSEFSVSSGYSDWVDEDDANLDEQPTKRTRRRQVNYNVDDEDQPRNELPIDLEVEESTSRSSAKMKKPVPEMYRTSEWLTETKPRKAPYFPQMGDELVYFPQGHQLYLEAVRTKKIYEINNKDLSWNKVQLKGHEFVKVVGIDYEIKPPRICCLKLALLDEESRLTGKIFTVKYHDMPDVLDFFVLKQHFEVSMSRNWNVADRFRCMIDDGWWIGEVVAKCAPNEEFGDSPFLCYEIKWDNGEVEKMSPWDMEPLNESRSPVNCGEALPVLEDELKCILYEPNERDWPNNDRDLVTKYIINGLSKVMELAIAEPFLVPVDLSVYPSYAFIVEYPIDLSTIKARFENHFYRRVTAAQFDIRYLAINAEKFNQRHSVIVRHAKILTELCLRIVKQCTTYVDVTTLYHQLVDTYDSSDTEVDVEVLPSNSRMLRSLPNRYLRHASDWKLQAKSLFDAIWNCEDSEPFRTPVNHSKYTDYLQIIKKPMDLTTVKEKLLNNKYESPVEFKNDMRLIFKNSRTYNTNKRSRIYVMTVRLAAIFEEHINKLLHNWNKAKRRNNNSEDTNESDNDDEDDNTATSSSVSDDSDIDVKIVKKDVSHSDSDSDEFNTPLKKLQTNLSSKSSQENSISSNLSVKSNKKVLKNESDNDSEDSFKPSLKMKRPLSSSDNNDSNNDASDDDDSDNDNSDNSDDKPLISQVKKYNIRCRKRLRSESTNNEESCSDEESSNDEKYTKKTVFTSVSSRGRVRKLTPRARALMK